MKARGLKIGLIGLAAVAVLSVVVMLLWNWLIPSIFGLAVINFWQALGLLVLARILFGRIGGGRHMMPFGGMNRHMHGDNPIHEKWMKMSPEQRKEFIRKRHDRATCFGKERGHFGGNPFDMNDNESKEEEK